MPKMKSSNLLFLLLSVGFIIFRGVEGYNEGGNWKAIYHKDGETITINSYEATQIFDKFKNDYLVQKNIDEKKVSVEILDRIEKIIVDDQISIHALLEELTKLDQILYNHFLTTEGREHLNAIREVIVGSLREYGKENPAFLEKFNEAEIALQDHKKFHLDPEIIHLQKVLVEEGFERCYALAKKMGQTNEGRTKLEKVFGNSTVDGKTFLEMLNKHKID